MKIYKLVIFLSLIAFVAVGCSKKTEEIEGLYDLTVGKEDKEVITQTITSPDEISFQAVYESEPIQIEIKVKQDAPETPLSSNKIEANKQIQAALENAGLYFGKIDGKVGPLTREAIEDFQKMKGLKADGKVGPITWKKLQKYLTGTPAESAVSGHEAQR